MALFPHDRTWTKPVLLASWLASGYLIARSYQHLIAAHGLSPYALAERADEKTHTFYDHLFAGVALPTPLSVLDIGCGLGDLIPYLEQSAAPNAYLGLDLVEAFVRDCQQRYTPPYTFRCQNFIHPAFQPKERYGVVVSLGSLVSRVVAYEEYLAYCCSKMLRVATHSVVFNVITAVQPTSRNYTQSQQIGQVTTITKARLVALLDQVVAGTQWEYELRDAQIYPDATDTFVHLRAGCGI
jgi:cyclopropane fatty-acyl-phospholipid synthase-like methyltransferase